MTRRGQDGTWGDPRRGCGQLLRTEGCSPGPLLWLGSWGVGVSSGGGPKKKLSPLEVRGSSGERGGQ